jgi:hypothetical protein
LGGGGGGGNGMGEETLTWEQVHGAYE